MLAAVARAYADWEGRCSARNRRKRSVCRGTGWAGLAGPAGRERSGLGRLGWCGKEEHGPHAGPTGLKVGQAEGGLLG